MARLHYPTAILLTGLLVWVQFSALFISTNKRSTTYVRPSPLSTTMAIKTRNSKSKEKLTKAGSVSATHSAQRVKKNRANGLLANINQPQNRFKGALDILGTLGNEDDSLDDPCDLVPSAENIGTGAMYGSTIPLRKFMRRIPLSTPM